VELNQVAPTLFGQLTDHHPALFESLSEFYRSASLLLSTDAYVLPRIDMQHTMESYLYSREACEVTILSQQALVSSEKVDGISGSASPEAFVELELAFVDVPI
jgi:hypothetical protein